MALCRGLLQFVSGKCNNMNFRTPIQISKAPFTIEPCERMLFVGSCFADNIGRRFVDDKFRAVVNPYGVMYNPASILHTVRRYLDELKAENLSSVDASGVQADVYPQTVVFTLGTNHVYILNETGEIVDNCRKRPQRLFTERELTIDECRQYLSETVDLLRAVNPSVRVVVTVSPIRYAKYGYHGSQLSKATLLLAADSLVRQYMALGCEEPAGKQDGIVCDGVQVVYFPAYEIVNDELRDYRFYREDMLHPSDQAVEYIWERFAETFFSKQTYKFLEEWHPLKAALAHRPFNPDGDEYRDFIRRTMEKVEALRVKYPGLNVGR